MDYKQKLKTRLYIAVIYILLGIMMIIAALATQTDNYFISSFGLMMALMGLVRIRNYRIITKNEETIKKQQIIETDERNISIIHKAKSTAFSIYILILGAALIILSLFNMHDAAKWIAYSVCLLIVIYFICYRLYQKKS